MTRSIIKTCLSTNRPTATYVGQAFFETDTKNLIVWSPKGNWFIYEEDGIFQNNFSASLDGVDDFLMLGDLGTAGLSLGCLSLWVNTDTPIQSGNTSARGYLAGWGSGSSLNGISHGNMSNPTWILQVYQAAYRTDWNVGSGKSLGAGWHHIALNHNGTGYDIYVDGVIASSHPLGGTLNVTPVSKLTGSDIDSFRIGINGTLGFPTDGLFDEVGIWNDPLTATEISQIYNSGKPISLKSYSPDGWWRMGDGTGDTDSGGGTPASGDTIGTVVDQGGSNNATVGGAPTYSNDRPYALPSITNTLAGSFDGTDDYLVIPDADIFSLGDGSGTDNAFSISAWFNADNIHTNYIATKDASGNREWAFRTVVNQLHFFAFGTGGGYIGRKYTTNLSDGQWYHAVVTYDGSKASSGIKLYLDGSRVDDADYASGTYTASVNTSTEVRVSSLQVNNTYSGGKVDELAFFNTELSASDITAIYNSGVPADISSLSPVAWYRIGDGTGDTDSGGGAPADADSIGTVANRGSASSVDATVGGGPTYSSTVPS